MTCVIVSLEFRLSKVGFPIRKSVDQSSFAAPHGLSQRSTSFIASQRQGIHRTPLRHLIALIINIHTLGRMFIACPPLRARTLDECCMRLDMIRKTSLFRKIEPTAMRSSSCRQGSFYNTFVSRRTCAENDLEKRKVFAGDRKTSFAKRFVATLLGSISSLRCQKSRKQPPW
jgi:hypothetical protein